MSRRSALGIFVLSLVVLVAVPLVYRVDHADADGVGALPTAVLQTPVGSSAVVTTDPVRVYSGAAALVPVKAQPAAVRLSIAGVGIDAPIDSIGVTATGEVAIPADAHRVGWYRFGPTPGDPQGSAVIVGHVDSRTQGVGALFNLRSVQVGDLIDVRRTDGSVLAYRVVERRLYLKRGVRWPLFFTYEGPPRLTVVTCGGAYLRGQGGYQDNLIVTAVPVAAP